MLQKSRWKRLILYLGRGYAELAENERLGPEIGHVLQSARADDFIAITTSVGCGLASTDGVAAAVSNGPRRHASMKSW